MTDTILVVDDEADLELLIRHKFRQEIRDNALQFRFAADGVEALEVLDEDPEIALVVTDINMPRMDGLTLLTELGKMERILRTIVVSAYSDLTNIRTAMNRGAFDFVTKPIDFEDLRKTVDKSLTEYKAAAAAANAGLLLTSIQKELDIAKRIQEAALPTDFPDKDEVSLSALMIPAREVGGDFYDFFEIDEHRMGLVMGDVSGKGVSAAMFMTVTRMTLKTLALKGSDPDICIRDLNQLLYPETLKEMFVTVFYGILDLRTGDLRYCNAGHNPPFILKSNHKVEAVERVGGAAVCLVRDFDYKLGNVRMDSGDILLLYTDGVTEAKNRSNELYSDERFVDLLASVDTVSSAQTIRQIVRDVSEFANSAEQSDDITVMAVKYTG